MSSLRVPSGFRPVAARRERLNPILGTAGTSVQPSSLALGAAVGTSSHWSLFGNYRNLAELLGLSIVLPLHAGVSGPGRLWNIGGRRRSRSASTAWTPARRPRPPCLLTGNPWGYRRVTRPS